jgi:hypothetical protein
MKTLTVLAALAMSSAAFAQQEYYPMKEGATWTYKMTGGPKDTTIVQTVKGKEKVGDVECWLLETVVDGGNKQTELVAATDEGLKRYRSNGMDVTPPVVFLKRGMKVGDKWGGEFKVGTTPVTANYEYAAEEDVEVAAGKFKAVKQTVVMDIQGQQLTVNFWWVKDVGAVKQTMDGAGMSFALELQKGK